MVSRRFSWLPLIGILAAIYLLAGKLGLMLASLHASASPVWPPAGIALAAMLLLDYRAWPAIFIGAFLVKDGCGTVTEIFAAGEPVHQPCTRQRFERVSGGNG